MNCLLMLRKPYMTIIYWHIIFTIVIILKPRKKANKYKLILNRINISNNLFIYHITLNSLNSKFINQIVFMNKVYIQQNINNEKILFIFSIFTISNNYYYPTFFGKKLSFIKYGLPHPMYFGLKCISYVFRLKCITTSWTIGLTSFVVPPPEEMNSKFEQRRFLTL